MVCKGTGFKAWRFDTTYKRCCYSCWSVWNIGAMFLSALYVRCFHSAKEEMNHMYGVLARNLSYDAPPGTIPSPPPAGTGPTTPGFSPLGVPNLNTDSAGIQHQQELRWVVAKAAGFPLILCCLHRDLESRLDSIIKQTSTWSPLVPNKWLVSIRLNDQCLHLWSNSIILLGMYI